MKPTDRKVHPDTCTSGTQVFRYPTLDEIDEGFVYDPEDDLYAIDGLPIELDYDLP